MDKRSNRGGNAAVAETKVEDNKTEEQAAQVAETPAVVAAPVPEPNYTIVYRREHPQNRCSYGISGVSGIIVFDKSLFAGGVPPETITMDVEMALPKGDAKAAREAQAAQRLIDKAAKAQARIDALATAAKAKQEKADKALADAKARVEAAKLAAGKTAATA